MLPVTRGPDLSPGAGPQLHRVRPAAQGVHDRLVRGQARQDSRRWGEANAPPPTGMASWVDALNHPGTDGPSFPLAARGCRLYGGSCRYVLAPRL
jgi:hypothetical protein